MAKRASHILVIRLSAMGDVAMTVPVLRAFVKQYPDVKLTVLTKPHFKPFFRDLKNVEVFEAHFEQEHKGFFGLLKLSRQLDTLRIDAVADLHNVIRSNVLRLGFFGKQFKQIDKGRGEKKALVNGRIFVPLKTTTERYADVFRALNFPLTLNFPKFPARIDLSSKLVALIGKEPMKWIGIAPFAAHSSKMYPLEKMREVIEALSREHKIILFGGGKSETTTLKSFQSDFENVINVAGQLSMDEELDVISNLDLMLAMDSGNGHLSAMLGVPTVTIWGVTHPYAGFAPFDQPASNALLPDRMEFPDIPTSIYGNTYPSDYEQAAGSISPEAVVAKVLNILAQ